MELTNIEWLRLLRDFAKRRCDEVEVAEALTGLMQALRRHALGDPMLVEEIAVHSERLVAWGSAAESLPSEFFGT